MKRKRLSKEQKQALIKQALLESCCIYDANRSDFSCIAMDLDDDISLVPFQEAQKKLSQIIEQLLNIIPLVSEIIKDNTACFTLMPLKDDNTGQINKENKQRVLQGSPLGKRIFEQLINGNDSYFKFFIKPLDPHPLITVWQQAVAKLMATMELTTLKQGSAEERFKGLQQFVEDLRQAAKQPVGIQPLSTCRKRRHDNAQKNYHALQDYIEYLMAIHPQLHIDYVELNYNPTPSLTAPFKPTTCPDYTTVKHHRQQFLNHLANPKKLAFLCDDRCVPEIELLGFAFSLQYNPLKGFYYQGLLFFNHTKIEIPRLLQALWHNIINKTGSFQIQWIEQDKKNKQTHNKKTRLHNACFLENAMIRLTLIDEYLTFIPTKSTDKTFTKGKPSRYHKKQWLAKKDRALK